MIQYGCEKLQDHYSKDLSICMFSHQKFAVHSNSITTPKNATRLEKINDFVHKNQAMVNHRGQLLMKSCYQTVETVVIDTGDEHLLDIRTMSYKLPQ